ncbi:hypothetical protein VTP01DRAFT_5044 [Rhizomucor pusillus]|uniref:uncharacterized protein n=1 Tax=Rhizomucor pusillus TaxID=4840 RepID=UPI00374291D1
MAQVPLEWLIPSDEWFKISLILFANGSSAQMRLPQMAAAATQERTQRSLFCIFSGTLCDQFNKFITRWSHCKQLDPLIHDIN